MVNKNSLETNYNLFSENILYTKLLPYIILYFLKCIFKGGVKCVLGLKTLKSACISMLFKNNFFLYIFKTKTRF